MTHNESLHLADAKLSDKETIEVLKEAVDVTIKIIIKITIPCRMVGMNSLFKILYITLVTDQLCLRRGYKYI